MEELKLCEEIINKVKWFMERKDYNGLRLYIEEKEKYVNNYISKVNTAEEDYIDNLIKENKVKWFMERKDYNGLRLYIEEKEKYVNNYISKVNTAEEDYIDNLIKDLK